MSSSSSGEEPWQTATMRTRKLYMRSVMGARDAALEEVLRHALLNRRWPTIQIEDNAGRILQALTMIHQPELVYEVGSLFGYSTIYIARGLPPNGRVIGLEQNADAATDARYSIELAGLSDRAEVVHCEALEFFATIGDCTADMIFLDADKIAYPAYLKAAARTLRPGGLLIADDVFPDGSFLECSEVGDNEAHLAGIRAYNKAVASTSSFFSAFIPTDAGLMLSVKR